MRADRLLAQAIGEPFARRGGVGHRLRRGEGFRGDEEERALRVEAGERVGKMRAVDIGDEVHVRSAVAVGGQRGDRHRRPEVGAADADIDDVVELVGGDAAMLAVADLIGKGEEALERRVHFGDDVLAVDADVGVGARAERDMKDGAAFRLVDRLAGEHRVAQLLHLGSLGERKEKRHRLRQRCGSSNSRSVRSPSVSEKREKRSGSRGEEIAQVRVAHRVAMGAELFERGGGGRLHPLFPSAAASRASVSMRLQSPLATASAGVTHDPPTATTFESAR